jgi:hypothetical protein
VKNYKVGNAYRTRGRIEKCIGLQSVNWKTLKDGILSTVGRLVLELILGEQ